MFAVLYYLFIKEKAEYKKRQSLSLEKIPALPVPPNNVMIIVLSNRVNDISQEIYDSVIESMDRNTIQCDQCSRVGGCGQILGPTMTGRKKNVVYGGREKESTSIV